MIRVVALALLTVVASGCAMLRGETPVTNPDPKTYPCGATGVLCADTMPKTCCPGNNQCVTDDAGPYCEATEFDPSDPVQWAARKRVPRTDVSQ